MRDDIVSIARELVGTPFLHQGRVAGKHGGTDCVGVLVLIARRLELCAPDFDVTGYNRAPDGSLLELLSRYLIPIDYADAGFGDVVAFVVEKQPQHVGVIVPYAHGGQALIHADLDRGVVCHRLLYGPRLKFIQAFRFPEVAWQS